MRIRIIDFFDQYFHVNFFNYLIPEPAIVYAIMLGAVAWLFIKRCGESKLSKYHASGIAIWTTVAALIGARLFYLIQNLGYVIEHPAILLEINGATVSFGVYLGGMLGFFLYTKMYKISPFHYLDVVASVLGLGPMLGRLACFLNGDDFGTLSHVPWAVQFPHGSYPFVNHVQHGWLNPMADLSLAVHPVQLYGSLKGLFLLVLFTWLWKKRMFKPGVLFLLFWMVYPLCRFLLEFFRGDEDRGWVGALSTGQFMSVCLFLVGLFLFLWLGFKQKVPMSFAVAYPQKNRKLS
ncbi:MAG: prolipoprotein diacylglyceryl transferase family protein [Bacteroidota bacterium]